MIASLRTARPGDEAALVAGMRAADVRELRDLNGQTPAEAMAHLLAQGGEVLTGRIDDTVVAMCGCFPLAAVGVIGVPWLLGTDDLARCRRHIVAFTGPILHKRWLVRHRLLANVTDGRNTLAAGWLRKIGFTMEPPVPLPNGAQAVRFWMERG